MERQPVKSSTIRSIGYNYDSQTLEIEFNSGGVYQYYNVPESVYNALMSSQSHGSFFHQYIKNKYNWAKTQ